MAIKASSKAVERVAKALGGLGEDLTEARINHIMKQRNLFGQTTGKIATEVAEHVGNSKFAKVKDINNVRKFGKAYTDDITDFAKEKFPDLVGKEIQGKAAVIDTAKEFGVEVGNKKIPNKFEVVSRSSDMKMTDTLKITDRKNVTEHIKNKESFYKERIKTPEQIKNEKIKYIDDQMREAGMRGLSGDRPDGKRISTKTLKGKMYDSGDDYMRYNAAKEHDEALKILELKDKDPKKFEQKAKNNALFNKMKGDREGYNHITKRKIEADRIEAIKNASKDQMGLTDYMGYHKIPQKAAAGVGTFWLVNKLAEGNGQQSNAQLYGQQSY